MNKKVGGGGGGGGTIVGGKTPACRRGPVLGGNAERIEVSTRWREGA